MANLNKVTADRSVAFTGSYGNGSQMTQDFADLGANAIGDVFYAMKVAKGSIITGLKLNAAAGLSAATGTTHVGYIMGGVTVNNYFAASFDSAAGGQVVSAAMPLNCTDDCYIILTFNVAATVAAKRAAITASFQYKGEL